MRTHRQKVLVAYVVTGLASSDCLPALYNNMRTHLMENPKISFEVWPLNTAQDISGDRFHYVLIRDGRLHMITSDRHAAIASA